MFWQDAIPILLTTLASQPRLGLVTDMDGTISPIVSQPDAAEVTPRCRDLLSALIPHLTLVAVISGRAVADVRERVNLPRVIYVGNHGLDWWSDGTTHTLPEAVTARNALEAALGEVRARQIPGMMIEDKGATASVHYRQTGDPVMVAETFFPILEQIAKQHDLRRSSSRELLIISNPLIDASQLGPGAPGVYPKRSRGVPLNSL